MDNGAVVVVGRTEARARLARFVRLLPQLLTQNTQQLALADLRYTNGFALTWKPVPATADAPGFLPPIAEQGSSSQQGNT